jgi:hypothetical protein
MVPFVSFAGVILIAVGVWGSVVSLKRDRLRF